MGFADATRARFAREANGGQAGHPRRTHRATRRCCGATKSGGSASGGEFLVAMRDYLRTNGVPEAIVLFTADAGEPGVAFPTWEKRLVTDDVEAWQPHSGRAATTCWTRSPSCPSALSAW